MTPKSQPVAIVISDCGPAMGCVLPSRLPRSRQPPRRHQGSRCCSRAPWQHDQAQTKCRSKRRHR
eukprot:4461283-Alexandrium_andersonii.AAC.1